MSEIKGVVPTKETIKGTVAAKGTMKGTMQGVYAKDGASAYEVALENGFEGSETEWLASLKGEKGEQGIRGEQGIQGVRGVSGVYLGAGDMPADCNVQIDPNGDVDFSIDQTYSPESTNPQSGVAVAEALEPFGRTYELIETIETTEGVQTISLNKEPNGNAYNFKDVFVKFTWNVSVAAKWIQLTITADGKSTNAFADSTYANASGAVSWIRTLCCYGHRLFLFTPPHTNVGYADYYATMPIQYGETDKPINAISIKFQEAFPVGTKIEVWGVRA